MAALELLPRHLAPQLREAMEHFRVAVVHGARQSGKSTLVRHLVAQQGGTYCTLDDPTILDAILEDPITFLTSQPKPLAVDEVQLGGDRVVRAVKRIVDEAQEPGQFVLSGSTNFLTVPTISESLAGRARILRLWPFSQVELAETASRIERWFDEGIVEVAPALERSEYLERLCRGGYPEAIRLPDAARRDWFESYLETVAQRDIVALVDIRKAASLRALLDWVAAGTSGELNTSAAARDLGVSRITVTSYLEWLERVFLIHEVPAWSRSALGRSVRRPKMHLTDAGLAAYLRRASPSTLAHATAPDTGPLLESFVVGEVARQLGAARERITMAHVRTADGHEVDIVLERGDGAVVAIEVKATASPTGRHLGGLRWLRDRLDHVTPGAFRGGYLLHTGSQQLPMGDRLAVAPISVLWAGHASE